MKLCFVYCENHNILNWLQGNSCTTNYPVTQNNGNGNNIEIYQCSNIVDLPPETPTPTETVPGLQPPPSYSEVVDSVYSIL